MWALLTLYQLLRMSMADAVETRPGTNPDRASFTTALQAARDQLTAAAGIDPEPAATEPSDVLGVIGRAVLRTLLPARRARCSARKVKCATSRYLNRDDGRPTAATVIAGIDISVHTPALTPRPSPRPGREPVPGRPPRPPTRREHITEIMNADPGRAWSGRELAEKLQVKPHNMLTQLSEWTRLGFLIRTGVGTYSAPP